MPQRVLSGSESGLCEDPHIAPMTFDTMFVIRDSSMTKRLNPYEADAEVSTLLILTQLSHDKG